LFTQNEEGSGVNREVLTREQSEGATLEHFVKQGVQAWIDEAELGKARGH
jgi:hypothetical protein